MKGDANLRLLMLELSAENWLAGRGRSLNYYIGTSGWHYEHWRGRFYDEELPRAKWLEFYASHFDTVEVNNSFYRLPTDNAFANWHENSPDSFGFALKMSRYVTHIKRLKDTEEAIDRFLERAKRLKDKLGPILFQLPPNMHRSDEVLESFLSKLPRGLKYVLEFRHQSWFEDRVFETLHKYNTGFCIFDMPYLDCPLVATADFAYIRFHGSTELYSSCYYDEELSRWAERITELAKGLKEVYIYFNNDAEAFAIKNAITLGKYLKT
jgi:uncharacterized protein YecE (DUF72 family)